MRVTLIIAILQRVTNAPAGARKDGKARRPNARRSVGQGADQRDRLATTAGFRMEDDMPAHAFTG